MKEFWLWVAIVTLLLFCIMALSFGLAYNHKQLKEAQAILHRLEEKEKKNERRKKADDEE